MVTLQLKKNDETLFVYITKTAVQTDDLIAELVELVNSRAKLLRLTSACDDLIEHGPLKPENEWGLSEDQIQSLALRDQGKGNEPIEEITEPETIVGKDGRQWQLRQDPTGRRTGEAPTTEMAEVLQKVVSEARSAVSKEVAMSSNGLNMAAITEAINNIRGAVTIIWPMGLPEYDPVFEILNGTEDISGTSHAAEVMPENSSLWWAGKELVRGKLLSDFIGKNEKTKILAKLTKPGSGAPARENPMNEQAQKEMMAFYFRKQEEHKKLMENDDDDYVQSSWANPKALKSNFTGVGNVSWRPT